MRVRTAVAAAACCATFASATGAERDLTQSKPQTAQAVTIARLAAVLCPETDVDESAVHALMDRAGITDRDIVDPGTFGSADMVVARSFARSFVADPRGACATVAYAFGPGEGRLLLRAGKPI